MIKFKYKNNLITEYNNNEVVKGILNNDSIFAVEIPTGKEPIIIELEEKSEKLYFENEEGQFIDLIILKFEIKNGKMNVLLKQIKN